MEGPPPMVHKALDAEALRCTGFSMLAGVAMLWVVRAVVVHTTLIGIVVLVIMCMLVCVCA
jgi:hypothetical protein